MSLSTMVVIAISLIVARVVAVAVAACNRERRQEEDPFVSSQRCPRQSLVTAPAPAHGIRNISAS